MDPFPDDILESIFLLLGRKVIKSILWVNKKWKSVYSRVIYKYSLVYELEDLNSKSGLTVPNFPHIRVLSLTSFYFNLKQMDLIKILNLQNSKLKKLSILPPNLEELNISNSSIEKLPDIFPNLKKLNLSFSEVRIIPKNLIRLEELEIMYSKLDNLGNLEYISTLIVGRTLIKFAKKKIIIQNLYLCLNFEITRTLHEIIVNTLHTEETDKIKINCPKMKVLDVIIYQNH